MVPPAVTGPAGPGPGGTGAQVSALTIDTAGPGGGVASDSAFGVALVGLWQAVAEAGGSVGIARPVVRSEIARPAAALLDGVKTGRVLAVVANRSRHLVAVGLLRPGQGTAAHTGRIALLLVHPDHTGAGVGTGVLQALLTGARARGVDRVDIEVADDDRVAGFLRRAGFTEWGRHPGWIRPGEPVDGDGERDEIIMGMTL